MKKFLLIGFVLLLAGVVYAAATVTYRVVDDMYIVSITTDGVTDQSASVAGGVSGTLQRVVFSGDGNDEAYDVSITDVDGATVFSSTGNSMVTDPYSYVSDYGTGGVPFYGGLTVSLANADDGDGNNVDIRLYIKRPGSR